MTRADVIRSRLLIAGSIGRCNKALMAMRKHLYARDLKFTLEERELYLLALDELNAILTTSMNMKLEDTDNA